MESNGQMKEMTIRQMFYSIKKYGFICDGEKYEIGDISEKTGLEKVGEGEWRKPKEETDFSKDVGFEINRKNLKSNREKLKNVIIDNVASGIIKGTSPKELNSNTKSWIESNIKQPVTSEIGEIYIVKSCSDGMFHHGNKENFRTKADAVPSIKSVLENGVYLGKSADYDNPNDKTYHFFAGKVKIDDVEKIVFCRVKDSNGDKLRPRLYFHDVFTEDDIEKQGAIPQGGTDTNGQKLTGTPLFKSLVYNFLYVNSAQTNDNSPTLSELFNLIKLGKKIA